MAAPDAPQGEDAAFRQAEALRAQGNLVAARRVAKEGLDQAKDDLSRGKTLHALGRADLDAGETASAIKSLEEASKLSGQSPIVLAEVELDLGRAKRRAGDLDGALRSLVRASDLFRASGKSPGERLALSQRGKVLYARNDLKGARGAFRAALDLQGQQPESWRLHHAIGRAYEKEGRKDEAEKEYRIARDTGWDGETQGGEFGISQGNLEIGPGALGQRLGIGPGDSPLLMKDARSEAKAAADAEPSSLVSSASRDGAGPTRADEDAQALAGVVSNLAREDLVRLVSLSAALSSLISPQALLDMIVDRAVAWTGAERGYVVLSRTVTSPAQGERAIVEVRAARAVGGEGIKDPEDEVSRNIVKVVVEKGEPVLSADASTDVRLTGFASVAEKSLRSVVCVPLRLRRKTLGALYLERRDRAGAFQEREKALVLALATHAAIVLERSQKIVKLEENYKETKRALDERTGAAFGIIGRARSMRNVFRLIDKLRDHDHSVLIEGATGTGKELVARAIHKSSKRGEASFVVESAGSLPEGLLEAELFGHEKGAFTGAAESRRGAFERADGGSLFLDEVGDMPPRMQALLLRVLETNEVRPIGAGAPRKIDVRIIAATRHDLRALVKAGEFREDLYFRLNVLRITVPSLEERKEDVPALAEAFLRELNRPASALTPRALEALLAHDWPGNVRELKHTIERAALLAGEGQIDSRHLGLDEPSASGLAPQTPAANYAGKVSFRGRVLNRRQLALIAYLRANGVCTNREYVELVKISVPTGWRDLKDLEEKKVLRAEGTGRNTVYRLEPWVKDELGTSTTDGS